MNDRVDMNEVSSIEAISTLLDRLWKKKIFYVTLVVLIYESAGFIMDSLVQDYGQKIFTTVFILSVLLLGIFYQIENIESYLKTDYLYEKQSDPAKAYIVKNKVKNVRIIQYTGCSVTSLIKKLLDNKCASVHLLLFDPRSLSDNDEKEAQERRISAAIEALTDCDHLKNLEIKLYSVPAAIRGFNFDDKHVIVGWYVYVRDNSKIKTIGLDNPVVSANTRLGNGLILKNFF